MKHLEMQKFVRKIREKDAELTGIGNDELEAMLKHIATCDDPTCKRQRKSFRDPDARANFAATLGILATSVDDEPGAVHSKGVHILEFMNSQFAS